MIAACICCISICYVSFSVIFYKDIVLFDNFVFHSFVFFMTRKQTIMCIGLSLLMMIAAFAFFEFAYPYHIHYQEQLQMFRFGPDYFREAVSIPGGLADWCSAFLTEFFYYAPLGAMIIALLLGRIQLLTWLNMERKSFASYPLSFLPAVALFLFFFDENALLSAPIAISIALALALLLGLIKDVRLRMAAMLILVPVSYMALGSIGIVTPVIVLAVAFRKKELTTSKCLTMSAAVLVLALASLFIARGVFSYPLKRLAFGIHYHRYHHAIPVLVWLSAALAVLAVVASSSLDKFALAKYSRPAKCFYAFAALIVLFSAAPAPLLADMQKELLFKYDFLVRMGQWNKILHTADKHVPSSPIEVECVNLALSKTGHMASDQFRFFQNGPAGLLPEFTRDHFSPIPTAEVYYNLGMINTAQTFFFEAQEGIPDFQKSSRLTKSLAKTNLINGDYEVARKYVAALKQTLFYRSWAKETEKLLDNPDAILDVPEYAWMRSARIKDHNFMFSQEEMDSMLGLLFVENSENVMASEYLLSWSLLQKDLQRFFDCHKLLSKGYDARHYQEAIVLYWALTHDGPEGMPAFITNSVVSRFSQFISAYQAKKDSAFMEKNFGDTYWFYYYYRYNS